MKKQKTIRPPKKLKSQFIHQVMEDARQVLHLEAQAVFDLSKKIDVSFGEAVANILSCKGKLIFTGMGKAGLIAQKIASTFSSLGRPSFFMHPAEAGHGDLGMVSPNDLVFLFSNSGNTDEITAILPFIKAIGSFTIGITGNHQSFLYKNVDIPLWIGESEEACGLGLAPTTSTTLMLALGDALAVSVLKQNPRFDEKQFALNHPRGSLGKKLLQIKNAMRDGDDVVGVPPEESLQTVIVKMTQAQIGSAVVLDPKKHILGIFSDGDLRRTLEKSSATPQTSHGFLDIPIHKAMTKKPKTIDENRYVLDALEIMSQKKIGEMPVVNPKGVFTGVICLKDLV